MNRKFFRVIGMQRSGIHAVADWIRMSHAEQGYSYQYDNAVPMEKPNEFAKYLPPKGDLNEPFLWMVEHEDIHFIDMPVLSPKIYSNFQFYDVLVIRDVFNTMASRHKKDNKLYSRRTVQWWKQYACEALNQTNFLGPNKIVVDFNNWHQAPGEGGYRANLAQKIGIEGVGAETNKLSVASSFDPNTTPVAELKLFDRWRNYADDHVFWSHFDQQVYELNTALFGPNEEVKRLIK